MARSRYDELHDKYTRISTTKAGTRYERLAALVFKCLDIRRVVIHDVRLMGETGVEHQIDVQIEVASRPRHILLECKDFDISGDKVGLEIVRNFWAVMDETNPDEGAIISCNGFTEEAQKYAKGKGIKLVVLRVFQAADWEDRLRVIEVHLNMFSTTVPRIEVRVGDDARRARLQIEMEALKIPSGEASEEHHPVKLIENEIAKPLANCVQERVSAFPKDSAGPAEVVIDSPGLHLQVGDNEPVLIERVQVSFDVTMMTQAMMVGINKIAELLLEELGNSDLVIFDDDLQKFTINPETGEVTSQ